MSFLLVYYECYCYQGLKHKLYKMYISQAFIRNQIMYTDSQAVPNTIWTVKIVMVHCTALHSKNIKKLLIYKAQAMFMFMNSLFVTNFLTYIRLLQIYQNLYMIWCILLHILPNAQLFFGTTLMIHIHGLRMHDG